jgi:hypothetical protein
MSGVREKLMSMFKNKMVNRMFGTKKKASNKKTAKLATSFVYQHFAV